MKKCILFIYSIIALRQILFHVAMFVLKVTLEIFQKEKQHCEVPKLKKIHSGENCGDKNGRPDEVNITVKLQALMLKNFML